MQLKLENNQSDDKLLETNNHTKIINVVTSQQEGKVDEDGVLRLSSMRKLEQQRFTL